MITPQQADFLAYYYDPTSETYCDAKNSALKAGYKKSFAENITSIMPKWLSDSIGKRSRLLMKAEKNLEEVLDLGVSDKSVLSEVMKASVFIAKTQGKDEGYSERTEVTGKDGKDLIPDEASKLKSKEALNEFLNGKNKGDSK